MNMDERGRAKSEKNFSASTRADDEVSRIPAYVSMGMSSRLARSYSNFGDFVYLSANS